MRSCSAWPRGLVENQEVLGDIGRGLLVLLGVAQDDTSEQGPVAGGQGG